MKHNFTVVPILFSKEKQLSAKMLWGFIKMRKAKIFPKHDFNFNHFNNLALVKDRFSHCENTGPHDKIPA